MLYTRIWLLICGSLSDRLAAWVCEGTFMCYSVLSHYQWSKALDEGKQVDVVFLKFEKAFDRVAHNILWQKTV